MKNKLFMNKNQIVVITEEEGEYNSNSMEDFDEI